MVKRLFKVNALGRVEQISAQGLEIVQLVLTLIKVSIVGGTFFSVTDARGYLYQYEYNQQNQVTVEKRPKVAVVSERGDVSQVVTTTTKRYDAQGSLVLEVDANGNQRNYQVNVYGEQISSTDGVGKTTYYGYDAFGRMVTTLDPSGLISYSLYNQLGLVTETGVTYKEQGAQYKTAIKPLSKICTNIMALVSVFLRLMPKEIFLLTVTMPAAVWCCRYHLPGLEKFMAITLRAKKS